MGALTMLLVGLSAAQEMREAQETVHVYVAADPASARRGRVPEGSVLIVDRLVPGAPGCEQWAELKPDGYACLDATAPTDRVPDALPLLVTFDPPTPEEYSAYLGTGFYDRSEPEPLLPYVYGRRYRHWKAPMYESAEAYAAGDEPTKRLGSIRKFSFVDVQETSAGEVLVRPDGSVVPVDEVYLYPISRHRGRDLDRDPVGPDQLVAWSVNYEGANVRDEPNGELLTTLPYHTPLVLTEAEGAWFELEDGGFIHANDIRWYVDAPAPEEVRADQLWIDIDRRGQTIALRRGEEVVYVTLVSTGEVPDSTSPLGLFEMQRMYTATDMRSGPDAEDPYYVENVPWSMFFYGPYALHGVFWHWGFGRPASHGCINLASGDAHYIFDRMQPVLPTGWDAVYATEEHPGTLVRIRSGANPDVPDKRKR